MEMVPGEDGVRAELLGPEPRVAHLRGRAVLGLYLHPDPDRALRCHGGER
jgi:hypothetical protein